jgi:hypothetical protein
MLHHGCSILCDTVHVMVALCCLQLRSQDFSWNRFCRIEKKCDIFVVAKPDAATGVYPDFVSRSFITYFVIRNNG